MAAVGAAGSALAATAVRFDPAWLIGLAAVAVALIAWSLGPWDRRRLVGFGLINGVLLGSLARGTAERSELTVQVAGDRVLATLGQASLRGDATEHPRGGVELTISPVEVRPQAARWANHRLPWLDDVALRLTDGLRSRFDRMAITGSNGVGWGSATPVLWQAARHAEAPVLEDPLVTDWALRSDAAGRVALVSLDRDWHDYRVCLELVRPGATIRLLVRADERGNGLAVVAAPDQRTFAIEEQLAGQPARTVSGGLFTYKRDAAAWLQALARELARPWLFGLVLVGLVRALTPLPVGRGWSVGRASPRPTGTARVGTPDPLWGRLRSGHGDR